MTDRRFAAAAIGGGRPPTADPPHFSLFVFDLDGTLIDSRADLANAVNHVLGALGHPPLPPSTLHRFVGDGARRLVERAMAAVGDDRVEDALARFLERSK